MPTLKCKAHQNDCAKYCRVHGEWICLECFEDHSDHFEKTSKGTAKHMYNVLKKTKKVVVK